MGVNGSRLGLCHFWQASCWIRHDWITVICNGGDGGEIWSVFVESRGRYSFVCITCFVLVAPQTSKISIPFPNTIQCLWLQRPLKVTMPAASETVVDTSSSSLISFHSISCTVSCPI